METEKQKKTEDKELLLENVLLILRECEPLLANNSIEVYYTDNETIKEINKKYFGKDEVTDILTFNNDFSHTNCLGELIINTEYQISINNDRSFIDDKKEIVRLFIHGILHLLGYDHLNSKNKNIMLGKEETYFNEFITRQDLTGILYGTDE